MLIKFRTMNQERSYPRSETYTGKVLEEFETNLKVRVKDECKVFDPIYRTGDIVLVYRMDILP